MHPPAKAQTTAYTIGQRRRQGNKTTKTGRGAKCHLSCVDVETLQPDGDARRGKHLRPYDSPRLDRKSVLGCPDDSHAHNMLSLSCA